MFINLPVTCVGRHLDLDHVTFEPNETKERTLGRELSLQMKLDYFDDEDVNMFTFFIDYL